MWEGAAEAGEGGDVELCALRGPWRPMIFYPVLCLHLTLIPAGIVLLMVAARSYVRLHQCSVCGYDTRATVERCPECGASLHLPTRPHPDIEQRILRILGIAFLVVPFACDAAIAAVVGWFTLTGR